MWQAAQCTNNTAHCTVHTAPAPAPAQGPIHLYYTLNTAHCIKYFLSHFANLSLHTVNIQNLPELDSGFTWKTVP